MFARSTTILGQVGLLDQGIAHMRDTVMPQVRDLPGCVGLSLLVDRHTGRCIATTAWDDEEAMQASADQVRPIREAAARLFGGDTTVEEWEIAFVHRAHRSADGACARVTWSQVEPDRLDSLVDIFTMGMMPKIEQLEGFCSVSIFVDRATGRACTTATYHSTQAMAAAGDTAMGLRADLVEQVGLQVMEIAEFELCLAHLDVPELV